MTEATTSEFIDKITDGDYLNQPEKVDAPVLSKRAKRNKKKLFSDYVRFDDDDGVDFDAGPGE